MSTDAASPDRPAGLPPRSAVPVLRRPVVIVGMMAAGKTTFGRGLAAALGVAYHDSDVAIERDQGDSGRALAADRGVEWLHALEAATVTRQFDELEPAVISAAASVVDSAPMRTLLAARSTICWIDVPLDVLAARINRDDHRRAMEPEELQRLYDRRVPLMRELADVRIDGLAPLEYQVNKALVVLAGASG